MSAILVRVLASRWVAALSCVGLTILLWDSGFGRLAAFDNDFAATAAAFLEQEALFVLAIIVVQMTGLVLMMTDRWMWLGTIALAGLALLTVPGTRPWLFLDENGGNLWAAVEYLSVFAVFLLAPILSALVRTGMNTPEHSFQRPELSWRQMVLAQEVGSRSGRRARRHLPRIFDASTPT